MRPTGGAAMMEMLEGRVMLAGNVTASVANGVLTITGDRFGNRITIEDEGLAAGSLRLVGDNTSINGEFGPVEFSGVVERITAALGDGKNVLTVRGVQSEARMQYFGGSSADSVLIDSSDFQSDLLIETRAGNDTVNLFNTSFNNSSSINTWHGDDLITIEGGTYRRVLGILSGTGHDTVFHHATFQRGIQIYDRTAGDLIQTKAVYQNFNFNNGGQGWRGMFSDVFANPTVSQNLKSGVRKLPAEIGSGRGFFVSSLNSTDDVFMFITRAITGLEANALYQVRYDIRFASNAPSNCTGVGGAPGESVVLKAGASKVEPKNSADEEGILRLNVDHGQQGSGGNGASIVGNIANGQDCPALPTYVSLRRRHIHTALVRADRNGNLHLIVGTDSGYEGTTSLYYQSVAVKLVRVVD